MNEDEDFDIEQPVEPAEEQAENKAGPSEIELEAARMGHIPLDQWRGDPEDWTDAEAFVKRGREIMPMLRKNNERLLSKLAEQERQQMEDRKTFEEFRKFHEQTLEKQKADALAQLRAARKEAIATGDGEAFDQADERIRRIESVQEEKREAVQRPAANPIFEKWMERNDWFTKDPALRAVADSLVDVIRADGVYDVGTPEFLEEVTRRVRAVSPNKFQNPARQAAAAVESPAPRARKPGGKTYDDLPAEAKKLCDDFVKIIPGYTREKYVLNYQWS